MAGLSDDDLNLVGLSDEELGRAWSLWFSIAQTTNGDDPLHTHGVFVGCEEVIREAVAALAVASPGAAATPLHPR